MLNPQTLEPPLGWEKQSLREMVEFLDSKRVPIKESDRAKMSGMYPYYGASGIIDYVNDYIFDEDLILLAEDGANILNRATPIAFRANGKIWVNNHAHVLRPKANADIEFVTQYLEAIRYEAYNTGSAQPKLNRDVCESIPVLAPPVSEQRKIAEILRTWDEALEKLEELRDVKERKLEGLVARMVHGAQDELRHLRDYVTEISLRNKGQKTTRVLSVTNATGFVLAEDQFAHRVASADISNYKIVRRGHYAYNPSRINVGSIARLDDWEEGALSPMYVVFETRKGLDTDYFLHWLRSAEARQRIALSAQGSVRETVSFGDFSSILIPIPPIEDQRQIAQALNLACDEIALIDEKITALQRQKRGLMQKLLTGEWRVQC